MTKVKICGLQTLEDAGKANRCRPDFVGLVLAKGSRGVVTVQAAAEIKKVLIGKIQTVGVFVNAEVGFITGLVKDGVIDIVQLHGDEDESYIKKLKSLTACTVIKAVNVGDAAPRTLPACADYLLFNTASAARGGTGRAFDWRLISGIGVPFFLAGGLNEKNVTTALKAVHPYCVDVSSGVETNSIKDEKKMHRFIRLVRKEGEHGNWPLWPVRWTVCARDADERSWGTLHSV